jgi:hypothetical protein
MMKEATDSDNSTPKHPTNMPEDDMIMNSHTNLAMTMSNTHQLNYQYLETLSHDAKVSSKRM